MQREELCKARIRRQASGPIYDVSKIGIDYYPFYFLRDKEKREVDFLIVKDGKPWFLVEAKTSETIPAKALYHFQEMTGAPHAFQAVFSLDPVMKDCFTVNRPICVPAASLLGQLV